MDLNALMKQAKQMQDDLKKTQAALEEKIYEGTSNGIVIKINGKNEAQEVSIPQELMDDKDILQDMIAGLTPEQQYAALTIIDRREAIKTASALAQPGDVILIAGKGHEDYQEIKGVKHHFDDKEEVEKIFTAQQNA